MWGATRTSPVPQTILHVSIHAPRVGRDEDIPRYVWACLMFQSTRPVWGATDYIWFELPDEMFQSTRPVWGATCATT